MRKYALHQTAVLLHRFAAQLERGADHSDADAIHDLRVSVRRLSRCLQVFSPFYPSASWKRVRRKLSVLMHAAGAVRDRDIAMELLVEAGVSPGAGIAKRLAAERTDAARDLRARLQRWNQRGVVHHWRTRLGL